MCSSTRVDHKEEYERIHSDFSSVVSQQLSGSMDSTRAKEAWRIVLLQANVFVLASVLSDVFFDISREVRSKDIISEVNNHMNLLIKKACDVLQKQEEEAQVRREFLMKHLQLQMESLKEQSSIQE